jgi:hypothetical protein
MKRNQDVGIPGIPIEVAAVLQPRPEDIAARAFDLYTRRGGTDGADLDDWLEAERQLVRERTTRLAAV